jgi:hypothetical protein
MANWWEDPTSNDFIGPVNPNSNNNTGGGSPPPYVGPYSPEYYQQWQDTGQQPGKDWVSPNAPSAEQYAGWQNPAAPAPIPVVAPGYTPGAWNDPWAAPAPGPTQAGGGNWASPWAVESERNCMPPNSIGLPVIMPGS